MSPRRRPRCCAPPSSRSRSCSSTASSTNPSSSGSTRASSCIQESGAHSWCGGFHEAACAAAGFEPNVGFQSDDYNVVQGLIAAGVGISLLPGLALTNVRDDIVVRSLGRKAPTRRIAAATLAGRYRSPATETMLGILEEVAARFELPSGAAVAAA